jgi:hypothetical protein
MAADENQASNRQPHEQPVQTPGRARRAVERYDVVAATVLPAHAAWTGLAPLAHSIFEPATIAELQHEQNEAYLATMIIW